MLSIDRYRITFGSLIHDRRSRSAVGKNNYFIIVEQSNSLFVYCLRNKYNATNSVNIASIINTRGKYIDCLMMNWGISYNIRATKLTIRTDGQTVRLITCSMITCAAILATRGMHHAGLMRVPSDVWVNHLFIVVLPYQFICLLFNEYHLIIKCAYCL